MALSLWRIQESVFFSAKPFRSTSTFPAITGKIPENRRGNAL
jgi:hypothetical protein